MSVGKFFRLSKRRAFSVLRPLDYGVYDPAKEMTELKVRFGWREYGEKHNESVFTHWFQSVFLVERYGIDKRRGDLASQIISGLITREKAIEKLAAPQTDELTRLNLSRSVAEKLEITLADLQEYLLIPHVSNHNFKTAFRDWLSP